MNRSLVVVAACALPTLAAAQSSPFLADDRFDMLVAEISGDRAFESVRELTRFHRIGGSDDFFAAAEWIRAAAEAAGMEDVRLVRQGAKSPGWSCISGEARLVAPREEALADCRAVAVSIADNSVTTHLTAALVDVGRGTSAADYEGIDVKDRIVLASGSAGSVHAEAVWKRGARGVISYETARHDILDAPDQIAWSRIPHEAKDVEGIENGTPGTFALMVSPRRGLKLRARLLGGESLEARVDIEARRRDVAEQAYVEAFIRGSEPDQQQIVLTAHIQEEKTSANDDGSGCASLLEIGRALARLVNEGRIPRPRRDIRFWWLNEFASQERVFREHPEEISKMLLNVNQDMVGARQSWGGRVQYGARLPWSRAHALEDVMESILGMVRDGNTELLTMRGTSLRQPFSREITAFSGSREPFHARMVPYFDSTDHHAFNPAWIGVPGTSLTNWPDDWIHSSGDDLSNIDATQIERNAVVVAGVALYFAALGDADLPGLAAHVASQGSARAAQHTATATQHLIHATEAGRGEAWRAAERLVRHAWIRERRGLASVLALGASDALKLDVQFLIGRMDAAESLAHESLRQTWRIVARPAAPPEPSLDDSAAAMARQVFAPVADRVKVMDGVEAMKHDDGLHGMMRFEALNFADGQRSAWEVYEAVAAEALAAGDWYFGQVTPAAVKKALDAAVAAGGFEVREVAGP